MSPMTKGLCMLMVMAIGSAGVIDASLASTAEQMHLRARVSKRTHPLNRRARPNGPSFKKAQSSIDEEGPDKTGSSGSASSECQCFANNPDDERFCESGNFTTAEACPSSEGRCHWGPEENAACSAEGASAASGNTGSTGSTGITGPSVAEFEEQIRLEHENGEEYKDQAEEAKKNERRMHREHEQMAGQLDKAYAKANNASQAKLKVTRDKVALARQAILNEKASRARFDALQTKYFSLETKMEKLKAENAAREAEAQKTISKLHREMDTMKARHKKEVEEARNVAAKATETSAKVLEHARGVVAQASKKVRSETERANTGIAEAKKREKSAVEAANNRAAEAEKDFHHRVAVNNMIYENEKGVVNRATRETMAVKKASFERSRRKDEEISGIEKERNRLVARAKADALRAQVAKERAQKNEQVMKEQRDLAKKGMETSTANVKAVLAQAQKITNTVADKLKKKVEADIKTDILEKEKEHELVLKKEKQVREEVRAAKKKEYLVSGNEAANGFYAGSAQPLTTAQLLATGATGMAGKGLTGATGAA